MNSLFATAKTIYAAKSALIALAAIIGSGLIFYFISVLRDSGAADERSTTAIERAQALEQALEWRQESENDIVEIRESFRLETEPRLDAYDAIILNLQQKIEELDKTSSEVPICQRGCLVDENPDPS